MLGGPQCSTCYHVIRRIPKTCRGCGQRRLIAYLDTAGQPCCSTCANVPQRFGCRDCGAEEHLHGLRCYRCVLRIRAKQLITATDGNVNTTFSPLYDLLIGSGRAPTLVNWIHRSSSAALVRRYVNDELPLTHDSLDEWPSERTATHVRQLFLAAGLLEQRDEILHGFEAWTRTYLAAHPGPHHNALQKYARWQISQPLHARARKGTLTLDASSQARQKIKVAAQFLQALPADTTSRERIQPLLEDHILAYPQHRNRLAPFISWAQTQKLFPLAALTITAAPYPSVALCETDYWATIHRLQIDEDLPLRARVAGLLVGLFAQQLTTLICLTADDLTEQGGKVQLRLGHDPITLPDHVAELLIDLRDSVPPWTTKGHVRWLFPSKQRAGQHIHKRTLGDSLLRYGIRTTPLRGAALINLASKIPVGPLSDLTGISNQAAARWAEVAGRSWNAYPQLRTSVLIE